MPVSYYILFAGIFLVLLAAVPYVVYLFGMTFGKKPNEIKTGDTANLPDKTHILEFKLQNGDNTCAGSICVMEK